MGDLVSFETEQEYNWVKGFMNGVKYIWTSGRLCNFDGCDRPDFEPKNINGWFWSANQARLAPSNSRNQFHDWSQTEDSAHQDHNQITVNKSNKTEEKKLVLPFSTIFTETVSNGTMLLVITRSQLSAKM